RVEEIDVISSAQDFWNDRNGAQALLKERSALVEKIENIKKPSEELRHIEEFVSIAETEGGEGFEGDIEKSLSGIEKIVSDLEFRRMMSGENDGADAIVVIHPGAGGTESQDWAEMLLRMYARYCERKGFKTEMIDLLAGDEAGIKSATFSVTGRYAYGFLKAEVGVHRLVRISPFDAGARRHTSFASVFVYPDVEDNIEIEIKDEDLRIDTYRASGAGGQHVNKTSSAVRLTHIPSGIVVQCQNERSQHKNRAMALKVLRARLYDIKMREKEAERAKLEEKKMDINFGSQIRSYVLHPYKLIKDLRTDLEIGNVDDVLDGNLDPFIYEYLIRKGN
ncbi:MAG: peptide chain release factor 2, partial [Deltaproteobacteria bacterium]|nr:peptide chain release factor 2 [Deltaproteobacteria bacterium]